MLFQSPKQHLVFCYTAFRDQKAKVVTTAGFLSQSLNPVARNDSVLKAMSIEKRGLYHQLLKF